MSLVPSVALLLALAAIGCSGTSFTGSSSPTKPEKAKDPKDVEGRDEDLGQQGKDDPSDEDSADATCKEEKANLALLDSGKCAITSNGKQATPGVYAVILTNPAPCDFRLPTVSVTGILTGSFGGPGGFGGGGDLFGGQGPAEKMVKLPIGTYWSFGGLGGGFGGDDMKPAHDFALSPEPPEAPLIDNGFILIQPNGKSYLLVDAGLAFRGTPEYQDAATIANQVSQSLGFGNTKLLRPEPGKASNDYADATVFKAGSVIAIYDDTPDMSGAIDVEALVEARKPKTGCDE